MARRKPPGNRHPPRSAPPAATDDPPSAEAPHPAEVAPGVDIAQRWREIVDASHEAAQVAEQVAGELLARVGAAGTALEAETAVSAFVGVVRESCPGDLSWEQRTILVDDLFQQVLDAVVVSESLAAGATVSVLATLAPAATATTARAHHEALAERGVPDLPWVSRLGRPRFVAGWTSPDDDGGRWVSLALAEGPHRHTVSVLVTGGTSIADAVLTIDPITVGDGGDAAVPDGAEPLDVDGVVEILVAALTAEPSPRGPVELTRVAGTLPVLLARLRSLTGA